jgi:hypothetical protein
MKPIPQWDVKAFECEVPPHGLKATGTVTHIVRDGWDPLTQQFQVEVQMQDMIYRFAILREDDLMGVRWKTDVLGVSHGSVLLGVESFALSNTRIEFLFEEALIKLSTHKVTE